MSFYRAPIVRFYYNLVTKNPFDFVSKLSTRNFFFLLKIFHLIYLGLFSYVVLIEYFPYPHPMSTAEMFLHLFIWSLIFEGINEVKNHRNETKRNESNLSFSSVLFDSLERLFS